MRFVRQHRSMILLWFTVSILLLLRRLFLFTQTTDAPLTADLSSRIDQRIQSLGQHFPHVNLSVLLHRPPSNQSPTITYRCREGCGGWGDRLRGIISTFMLAVLTGRQFSIDMPNPCDLQRFLMPNLYDWRPIEHKAIRSQRVIETTRSDILADDIYRQISSKNFPIDWSGYDDIYIQTNSDYITPALANPHLRPMARLLNFTVAESSLDRLFPLLYELLFRPTEPVMTLVDQLLVMLEQEEAESKPLICVHLRIGKNPSILGDKRLAHRETMLDDVLQFVDGHLSIEPQSMLFVTSDSSQINERILAKYGPSQALSVPGPVIHIDRLSSSQSSADQCQGFLKVIADFYVLGECHTLIMARSGFSQWASRRRRLDTQFDRLYLYCRGIHQITGHDWRRPHTVC